MGQPDFKAFEDFVRADPDAPATHIPRNTQGKTSHYLHINNAAYAAISMDQKHAVHAAVMDHLDKVGLSEYMKYKYSDMLAESTIGPTLSELGGGISTPEHGLIITDSRTTDQSSKIENVIQKDIGTDQRATDHYAHEKVRRHEAAHLTLDLDEPGSDFIAAATMLRDMPESRRMWENEADLRMVHGFKSGVPSLHSYGVECHDAIKRALAMTPAELKGASTETLYAIGMEYDTQNALNRSLGPKSAEGKILQAISTETGGAKYNSLLKTQWDSVTKGNKHLEIGVDEAERFDKTNTGAMVRAVDKMGTKDPEIRRVGDALKESIGRLDRLAEPDTAAPAQKPEIKTLPALAN